MHSDDTSMALDRQQFMKFADLENFVTRHEFA